MKHIIYTCLAALAFTSASWFNLSAEKIQPYSVQQSECKGHTRGYEQESGEITYNDNVLTLLLRDIEANCGAELYVECNTDIPGEIHFIISDKSTQSANCVCPFDVECKYEGVLTGHYEIFVEYGSWRVLFHTTVDLTPECKITLGDHARIDAVACNSDMIMSLIDNNRLDINADGLTTIDIYDSNGQRFTTLNIEGHSQLDLNTLPKGIYLIKAKNGKRSRTLKFIR